MDEQQSPATQAPSQHFEPAPHSVSLVHAVHWFPRHCWPPAQSAAVQHEPAVQRPPQQTAPAPHCSERVHARHWFPRHTRLLHAVESQQSPALHPPAQHTVPFGQSSGPEQVVQLLLTQLPTAPQSTDVQQSPVTQRPEQHRLPGPHC